MGRLFDLESPLFSGLNKMADLIYLNILTLICCIPIITIGASMTALNYVVLKMVRNEDSHLTRSYFKSFKQNFKQATVIWLIILLAIIVLAGDFYIFTYSSVTFPLWLKVAFIAIAIVGIIGVMHVFPVLARFDNTTKNIFKNSLFMGILTFPKTVLMIVCWIVPVVLMLFVIKILPIVFCLGISGPAFVCALLYNKTFKRFEPEEAAVVSDEEWTLEPLEGEGQEEAGEEGKSEAVAEEAGEEGKNEAVAGVAEEKGTEAFTKEEASAEAVE
ncbi:MAG: YesL family protein [Clostridium sp.]|nr:YesL family protein [Clostridium sp.]